MGFNLAALFGAAAGGKNCVFCDHTRLNIIERYEDIMAIRNVRSAGEDHILIVPILHVRDIESLNAEHLQMLEKMDRFKKILLRERYPSIPSSDIHSGYHRGHRPVVGNFGYPDIISIHHLHLHVIIKPSPLLKYTKYGSFVSQIFVSDDWVLERLSTHVRNLGHPSQREKAEI